MEWLTVSNFLLFLIWITIVVISYNLRNDIESIERTTRNIEEKIRTSKDKHGHIKVTRMSKYGVPVD